MVGDTQPEWIPTVAGGEALVLLMKAREVQEDERKLSQPKKKRFRSQPDAGTVYRTLNT